MSYLKRTTLADFDEAYRYGAKLTSEELEIFDKLLSKIKKEFGEDSSLAKHLEDMREFIA